ncbi:hypothetical protein KM043_008648 [Ampulex compressa]|nr:hypothetical protein KM043_008648 [Ampulex compressa]
MTVKRLSILITFFAHVSDIYGNNARQRITTLASHNYIFPIQHADAWPVFFYGSKCHPFCVKKGQTAPYESYPKLHPENTANVYYGPLYKEARQPTRNGESIESGRKKATRIMAKQSGRENYDTRNIDAIDPETIKWYPRRYPAQFDPQRVRTYYNRISSPGSKKKVQESHATKGTADVKSMKDHSTDEKAEPFKPQYVRDHAPDNAKEDDEDKYVKKSKRDRKKAERGTTDVGLSEDGDRVQFQIEGHQGPKTYIFGFDTGNGGSRQYRLEEKLKDGTVKGRYGYYDAKGKLRAIQYIARPDEGYEERHHEMNFHKERN